jgi:hypothetical protein
MSELHLDASSPHGAGLAGELLEEPLGITAEPRLLLAEQLEVARARTHVSANLRDALPERLRALDLCE